VIAPAIWAAAVVLQDATPLTLDTAIARALASYPTVAVARAQRDRTDADVGAARSALLPHLSLDGSLTHYQEPMIAFPLHSLNVTTPPFFDRTIVQSSTSLTYTVFDFGGRAAQLRGAGDERDAADAVVTSTAQQLMVRTAVAYLHVLTARDDLGAEEQRLATLAVEADQARSRLAVGKAAQVEVLRADAELQRARADHLASVGDLDVAEHELVQLIALPYERVHSATLVAVRLVDTALIADTDQATRAALAARALAENPDVVAAQRRADAAQALLGAARASRFPQLRLSGAYLDQGSPAGRYDVNWQVAVGLSYPVFTGGAIASEIRGAGAYARASREQARLARLSVEQNVDRAIASLREAHALVSALEIAVAQSAEVARIEQLSRDVGQGTQTDYLSAQANLLHTRASLIEARHVEITSRIELAEILGELSPAWIARNVESAP
jgi:outer membrane protein